IHSPEHLVPGGTLLSSRPLQAPERRHGRILSQAVKCGSTRSTILSACRNPAILGRPPPAKAAATPNPHRRPTARRFPAGSFIGGFPTLAPCTRSIARAGAGIRNPSRFEPSDRRHANDRNRGYIFLLAAHPAEGRF